MAAVRASGLVKRFETTCALDGVDLVVEPGEGAGFARPQRRGQDHTAAAAVRAPQPGRVAIRRLELLVSPLESMFFALTGEPEVDDPAALAELADEVLAGT